jgi:hypothetical protein
LPGAIQIDVAACPKYFTDTFSDQAPTGRNVIAQGNALGNNCDDLALKGRNDLVLLRFAPKMLRPFRADFGLQFTQGVAHVNGIGAVT